MAEIDTAIPALACGSCLLIVLSRVGDDFPLIVAANRDELLDRPAQAMAVLLPESPEVLGGYDEQGGGTWLGVNELGVFAGLTNRPTTEGRDPRKRSRGEIPLALADHQTAREAVDTAAASMHSDDYNPCWVLVGDRESLFAIDMSGSALTVEELPPGIHILENRPLHADSPKVRHVRHKLDGVAELPAGSLDTRLAEVLSDHEIPAELGTATIDELVRPPVTESACVHTERYGTRWSGIIRVPPAPARPSFRYADGPPCQTEFQDASW